MCVGVNVCRCYLLKSSLATILYLPFHKGPVRFAHSHFGRGICDVRFDLLLILEAIFSLPKNQSELLGHFRLDSDRRGWPSGAPIAKK
jgi:hypothetical protein